jgi:hypothetical protein
MPPLKNYIALDLATFFNLDEFADLHDIDGQQVPAIIDSDVLKKFSRGSMQRMPYNDGVYTSETMLFVRESDLGYRPVIGQHLRLDGEHYLVTDCTENAGVLEITLEANRA